MKCISTFGVVLLSKLAKIWKGGSGLSTNKYFLFKFTNYSVPNSDSILYSTIYV